MSKFTGADQLQTRLKWVRDRGSKRIGGAMIRAGMRVIGGAMRSACPGSISAEIGTPQLNRVFSYILSNDSTRDH